MRVEGLIWLNDVVEKLRRKHRVEQQEVREALDSVSRYFFIEKGHRAGENVYAAPGQTVAGRHLLVLFIYKKPGQALILSARDMTDSERKRYGRK